LGEKAPDIELDKLCFAIIVNMRKSATKSSETAILSRGHIAISGCESFDDNRQPEMSILRQTIILHL